MDHKLCVRLQYNPIVRLIERFDLIGVLPNYVKTRVKSR